MKFVLKNNKPKITFGKSREDVMEESDDSYRNYFFNFILASSKIILRGNNSKSFYMNFRMYLTDDCPTMQHPEKYFLNELYYKYDWITEWSNLQNYLVNPYAMENRYMDLSFEEIKRKGFMIISRSISGLNMMRLYKQQKVIYMLHHRSKSFPSGWIIVHTKPEDIVIRYDSKKSMIRLEGPACIPIWQKF